MSKEALKIGVDLGTEKDEQCAVILLHYDGINHIIFETHDKEQIEALSKIKQQESFDNANSNEAMEYIENIQNEIEWSIEFNEGKLEEYDAEHFDVIKQALLKFQKEHKALEIIKEKDVDIFMLRRFETLEAYNNYAKENKMKELTQEEFNLLKEVLE